MEYVVTDLVFVTLKMYIAIRVLDAQELVAIGEYVELFLNVLLTNAVTLCS